MGFFSGAAKWFGIDNLRAAFRATAAAFSATRAREHIEEYLLNITRDRFAPRGSNPVAQTAPDGSRWAPLAKNTVRRRKSNRNAAQALVDTGELLSAIRITRNSPTSSNIEVDPSSPAAAYAMLHQYGGRNKYDIEVPARPFLGYSDDLEEVTAKNLYDIIRENMRKSGLQ